MISYQRPSDHTLSLRAYLLLAVFSLFAFIPGIGSLPPTDRDEARFVQTTKQMVESGDFIDLRFQDEPRYKKPAGIYWLQSLTVSIYGEGVETPIWVYRTVSTVAGVASVLMIAWLGGRMFGATAGLTAGFLLGGILILGFEARIAKTDAALLAATIAAQASLAHVYLSAREGRSAPRAPWLFWVAQGASILIKGPVVAAVSLLTICTILWFDRDRSWLRRLRAGWGIPLALFIAAPWLVLITWKSGAAFWQEAVGNDLLGKVVSGQESHGAPPGYYFILYSATFWPFGLAGVVAGLAALRRLTDPRLLFCVGWYIPFWLVLEVVPTKLPHYILPVYPAMALAAAWAVTAMSPSESLSGWRLWLYRAALAGSLLVTLALAVVSVGISPFVLGSFSLWGLAAAFLVLFAGWLGSGIRPPVGHGLRLPMASVAAATALGVLGSQVAPSLTPLWLSPQISSAFVQAKPCLNSHLVAAGYHEPSLVFLAGTDTVLTDAKSAGQQLSADKCAVALVADDDLQAFEAGVGEDSSIVRLKSFDGFNYSKGSSRVLALYANAN